MQDSDVEVAVIKSQLAEIKTQLTEIKVAVTDLVSIKADVATQAAIQRTQDEKIRALQAEQEELERRMQEEVSFTATLKGGFKLAAVAVGVVQAIVIALCGWVGTTLIESREAISALSTEVRHVEQDVKYLNVDPKGFKVQ